MKFINKYTGGFVAGALSFVLFSEPFTHIEINNNYRDKYFVSITPPVTLFDHTTHSKYYEENLQETNRAADSTSVSLFISVADTIKVSD